MSMDDYVCSVPAEHDGCKMYTNARNTIALLDDIDDYQVFVDKYKLIKTIFTGADYNQWTELSELIVHTTHKEPIEIYCKRDKILVALFENECYLIAPQVQREIIDYE